MKRVIGVISAIGLMIFGGTLMSSLRQAPIVVEGDDTVIETLAKLGEKETDNVASTSGKNVSAEAGKRMVLEGFSQNSAGQKMAKLSNHFVCTSCHNIVKEHDDLTSIDPQERLEYAVKNNLPFLQGSSLYGLVNRASFYNGDYVKKYGDKAIKAHNDIREAIQLCAIECAQGRRLKTWELESVLAYLWTIQLKIEDLNLTTDEQSMIEKAINTGDNQSEAIALIQSKYRKDSPATFGTPPDDISRGYDHLEGNASNGKLIYKMGCQHCHENRRYSFLELDDSKLTFNYLKRKMKRHNRFSFYWVSRYGTKPLPGKKAYMPHYTLERMSDQQLEDLRAFIDQEAD